jgi:hypothetical protein
MNIPSLEWLGRGAEGVTQDNARATLKSFVLEILLVNIGRWRALAAKCCVHAMLNQEESRANN